MDAFEVFVKSLLRVPSTSSLTEYSERLDKGHCSNTLNLTERSFLPDQPFRGFQKEFSRNLQKKFPWSTITVTPNLRNISGRKCL